MVEADGIFAVLPAKPYEPVVDSAVEVEQAGGRALLDAAARAVCRELGEEVVDALINWAFVGTSHRCDGWQEEFETLEI